jgi:hypothetical protein
MGGRGMGGHPGMHARGHMMGMGYGDDEKVANREKTVLE